MHSSFSSEKNKPNLYLVGMMGTGKSTIGKVLADQLSMNFIDSDESIEKSYGQSISEIFTRKGEDFFRKLEQEFITSGHQDHNLIVSCGGGLCIPPGMMELLKTKGKVICLWASPETLLQRTETDQTRPLLQVSDPLLQLQKLISQRESRYREADHIINTDELTVNEVVQSITKALQGDC